MSEAMTNTEIEDVLSSIRRLVAQEARPAAGRLVLTAAQRVVPLEAGARLPEASAEQLREAPVASPAETEAAAGSPQAEDWPEAEVEAEALAEPMPQPVDRAELEATITALESVLEPVRPEPTQERPAQERPALVVAAIVEDEDDDLDARRDDDIALIDEAELRILIARLVREELHGQLGERITLQVRKLVRAEIARALDERNLLS